MNVRASTILRFWFGETVDHEGGASDPAVATKWFKKDAAFDDSVREAFSADMERAASGELDAWATEAPHEAKGALALVVLCDQFPRNVFRDSAKAFAQDARALAVTQSGRAKGLDRALSLLERYVFLLPLMHAEEREIQRESVAAFTALAAAARATPVEKLVTAAVDFAERHAKIVERFGRYPHRNAILARPSTEEEVAFLKESGSSF